MNQKNKGFVVSAVLYPLLVLFLALIMGLLAMTDTRKRILDKMKLEISDSIFDEATCSCDTILNKLNYLIKNGVGGGGGGSYTYNVLGLNVKNYEDPSSMPNVGNGIGDIAVITDTEISNYYVSSKVPESPKVGTVWIVQDKTSNYYVTSDYSKIGISYAMQYICDEAQTSCEWQIKKAYVYDDAKWNLLYYVPVKDGIIDLTSSDINAEITHTYAYTGEYQTFTARFSGIYKVELWGAQGGSYGSNIGGRGAYTEGKIYLDANQSLYIYVGGQGQNGKTTSSMGGWNGGGSSGTQTSDYSGGGGGATDVRLTSTSSKEIWNEFDSLKSRIMVAAGGGGVGHWSSAETYNYGGVGGGLVGYSGNISYNSLNKGYIRASQGGTQTMPGSGYLTTDSVNGVDGNFGIGATMNSSHGGGGGGGYYGGGSGGWSNNLVSGGAGGSSYISGMAGVNSISEASVASNIIHTGNQYHYSGKYFYDTVMIDGYGYKWNENIKTSTNQPNKEGTSIQIGNTGNGYAKIELISIGVDIGPEKSEYINSYSFQDKAQEFKTPVTGTYKVELWGASGSSKGYTTGGKGAYTSGEIYLKKDELFYIYVGETGEVFGRNAYNGGGSGTVGYKSGSGGGATDIRLVSGIWSSYDSLKTRIMVAAGGGGAGYWSGATAGGSGGSAGGLLGYSGSFNYASSNDGYLSVARGGSQTIGGYGYRFQHTGGNGNNGSFGRGANGDVNYGGGGGGGYYGGGGGAASNSITGQGGGGSSYISGHKGCNSILEESTSTNIIHNGSPYHYSGYFFENTNMVDGNGYKWESDLRTVQTNMPSYNSDTLVVGNTGNGYARITLINTEKKVSGEAEYTNYSYSFSNSYQIFDVLNSGNYKIELWGASGGDYSVTGGSGAYTSGEINLLKGTRLFVFVGQSGMAETITTFNGGGDGRANRSDNKLTSIGMSGGGATDIRTIATSSIREWQTVNSLKSRIMVAAGGGGSGWWSSATSVSSNGSAGGLIGYSGGFSYNSSNTGYKSLAQGGTQLSGGTGWIYNSSGANGNPGTFGIGGGASGLSYGGGGGGGWYGGGSGNHSNNIVSQGGGGSSYISGHAGCIAVTEDALPKVEAYTTLTDSISYTGYKFTNTIIIDGKGYSWSTTKGTTAILMPTFDGLSTMTGNRTHGYARITYLGA